MSKHGVNVPRGVAVSSVEEIRKAIKDFFPNENEVIHARFDAHTKQRSEFYNCKMCLISCDVLVGREYCNWDCCAVGG